MENPSDKQSSASVHSLDDPVALQNAILASQGRPPHSITKETAMTSQSIAHLPREEKLQAIGGLLASLSVNFPDETKEAVGESRFSKLHAWMGKREKSVETLTPLSFNPNAPLKHDINKVIPPTVSDKDPDRDQGYV